MYTFIIVLLIIVSILLALIVLVQNSKGGGLASGFSASNQIMGVRKTTDLLEKLTWGFAIALVVLTLSSNLILDSDSSAVKPKSVNQERASQQGAAPAAVPATPQAIPAAGNAVPGHSRQRNARADLSGRPMDGLHVR